MKKSVRIRVAEIGLIQVQVDAELVWGIHNDILSKTTLQKGDVFNSLDWGGSWHDVCPKRYRKDGRYFHRIGNTLPHEDVKKWNKQNKRLSTARKRSIV